MTMARTRKLVTQATNNVQGKVTTSLSTITTTPSAAVKVANTTHLSPEKSSPVIIGTYNKDCGRPVTDHERRVYELICTIPEGKVATYGEVARALGSGPRGVGQALRRNPFAPEVPCHRVVAATFGLGGFQGEWGDKTLNVGKKKELLLKEGVIFQDDKRVSKDCIYFFGEGKDDGHNPKKRSSGKAISGAKDENSGDVKENTSTKRPRRNL